MKKYIYGAIAIAVAIALTIAGMQFFRSAQKNKTLDQVTMEVGTTYSGKSLMCDLKFTNVTYKTKSEKIAQVSPSKYNGLIMPISSGTTEIVMTGTYNDETYTRTLPVKVKDNAKVKVGVDVSAWNDNFDVSQVKSQNVDFVMLRLGVSEDVDKQSRLKAIALKKANIGMGAYWYLSSSDRKSLMTVKEATAHAKKFVRMLNNMEGKTMAYPLFIDLESTTLINSTNSVSYLENLVKAFVKVLNDNGYTDIGLYANRHFLVSYLTSNYFQSFTKIWYARYGYAKTGPYADGSHAYLWQTGDQYKSKIVNNKMIDYNYLYSDYNKS